MKIATVSSKNQITLPASILALLGIGPKSKVIVEKTNETIVIKPLKKSIVEMTAGSLNKYVHPSKLGIPFEEVRKQTQKMVAKELAEKA